MFSYGCKLLITVETPGKFWIEKKNSLKYAEIAFEH